VSLSQGLDHNMLMVAAGLGDLPIVQCLVEIGGRELLMAKTKHVSGWRCMGRAGVGGGAWDGWGSGV